MRRVVELLEKRKCPCPGWQDMVPEVCSMYYKGLISLVEIDPFCMEAPLPPPFVGYLLGLLSLMQQVIQPIQS